MKKSTVIIGSNFGDEGKGRMVDYFASIKKDSIVVRFNGGCQAVHTVHDPETKQVHQFGHFGSGTICNIPTYLSNFFIVNPFILFKELEEYKSKFKNDPKIIIHPDCLITTPWDMMINQQNEINLGKKRNGTCGLGINETIVRSQKFPLKVRDIFDENYIRKVNDILKYWVPERCKDLDIILPDISNNNLLYLDFLSYSNDIKNIDVKYTDVLRSYKDIIFEGAQGLLLDEDSQFFPHVTRSKTGIKNVISIAEECGITDLDLVYVTRCYLTRHGAGPLHFELLNKPFKNINDDNKANRFQGAMRFAPLNYDLLIEGIKNDLKNKIEGINITLNIAMTCIDQIGEGERIPYIINDQIKYHSKSEDLYMSLYKYMDIKTLYIAEGKEREKTRFIVSL